MIIFQGQVDLSANIQRKKRMNRKVGIYALIACIIVLVLALIVNFVCFPNDPYEDRLRGFLETVVYTSFLMILAIILIFKPVKDYHGKSDGYMKIEVDESRIRVDQPYFIGRPFFEISTYTDVRKFVEYDDYYYIYYKNSSIPIICQKNLLVEGTLEEFEKVFSCKIVRKNKKSRKSNTTPAK